VLFHADVASAPVAILFRACVYRVSMQSNSYQRAVEAMLRDLWRITVPEQPRVSVQCHVASGSLVPVVNACALEISAGGGSGGGSVVVHTVLATAHALFWRRPGQLAADLIAQVLLWRAHVPAELHPTLPGQWRRPRPEDDGVLRESAQMMLRQVLSARAFVDRWLVGAAEGLAPALARGLSRALFSGPAWAAVPLSALAALPFDPSEPGAWLYVGGRDAARFLLAAWPDAETDAETWEDLLALRVSELVRVTADASAAASAAAT
jgi:hypothetical protein